MASVEFSSRAAHSSLGGAKLTVPARKDGPLVKGKEIRKPKKAAPPKQNASNPSAKGTTAPPPSKKK